MAARLRATSDEAYAATAAALRDADLREAIRGVTHRVLVIVGTQDPATPPAAGGLIAEHVPGARLVALEAAHLSNIEAANDFTRAIVSFLTAPAAASKPAARATKKAAKKAAGKKAPAKKRGARKAAKKSAKKATKKAAKAPPKRRAKRRPRKRPRKRRRRRPGSRGQAGRKGRSQGRGEDG